MREKGTWGGRREGAGSEPIYDEPMTTLSVRVTHGQKATFKRVGGVVWLRDTLDLMDQGEHQPKPASPTAARPEGPSENKPE